MENENESQEIEKEIEEIPREILQEPPPEIPKKRGRPPRTECSSASAKPKPEKPEPKKRGRPPKAQAQAQAQAQEQAPPRQEHHAEPHHAHERDNLEDLMRFLLTNPKQHRYEARRAQWNNFKMR
jgi:hypothetical protein